MAVIILEDTFPMDTKVAYLKALNNVFQELQIEKAKINSGNDSLWTLDVLMSVIQPEVKQLLTYACKNEAFFKYGDIRQLESTVFLSQCPEVLSQTDLGRSILELQEIYNNL